MMSANDEFFCEHCEDTGIIELDDHRSVPCPHCRPERHMKKNNELVLRDYDWEGD